ncbi:tail length tape measure protein [Roseobacter phage RDJL Phi 1]|uniref:Tail tape measure protein n=1 Tax=Roseobacter phage RDJL Phi 1 TaxID=562742 RepID=F4YXU1_9CAUD|nr:tail length tape measure protein [Roseobacter phage RDJL Phi 1]ADK73481.1 tail tape measure protein [Roseobacter phage RDJL Phi 1]
MADFRIRVVVDPSGATRGTRQVERNLNRVGDAATRVQRLIARAFAFTGIGLGFTATLRTLANFEQQMSTVRAITGATEVQFRSLRAEAQRLGSTTRFSASEAAEGMQFLARAGFDVNQVLASIDDTLLLAQAGALDLASAADIASNILTGFRLNAAEASRVVDVLALASNSANTNVFQLGEAMKFVAPVAAGLGVSVEEAAAAVSALSDAGLQGSLAGTGLRRVLAELESPASKTVDILQSLGVAAEDVRVSQVGLTTALTRLRDAGVDTGLALEIFGDRGGPAFEVLSNAIPRVEQLTDALGNAEGTALRIATVMDDNLNGALLSVKSATEGLILAIGEAGGTGALTGALNALANGIRFVTENADTFIAAIEALTAVIVVRLIGSAMIAMKAQLFAIALAFQSGTLASFAFAGALSVVRGALLAIAANPVTAIFLALGTVAVALTTIETQTERVNRITTTLEGQVRALQDAYADANGEVENIRENIEGLTLTEALTTQTEAADELNRSLRDLTVSLTPLVNQARYQGFAELSQDFFDLQSAMIDGTATIDEVISTLDRLGQQAPEALREMVAETIAAARETKNLGVTVERSDAIIRFLTGTASAADRALLGMGAAAGTAADEVDNLGDQAVEAISALRTLQAFIPELARAAQVTAQLGEAQAAYEAGRREIEASIGQGRSIDQAAADLEELTQTYNRATAEIDGTAAATRSADEALTSYTNRSNLDALEGQNRAVAIATQEYEALVTQLEAAGASQEDLAAAQAAYNQQLANINRDFADTPGSGSGGGRPPIATEEELTNMSTVLARLQQEREILRLNNFERETRARLEEVTSELAQNNIVLGQRELEIIRQKIVENQRLEEALNFVGDVTETVFGGIDDALADFIRTGEFNFKQFATNIIAELARIVAQATLIKPLIAGIGSLVSGNGFTFDLPDLGSVFANIGGNQFGGSLTMGGSGGPDSQLFVSKVSPGERIDFTPEGEGSRRGGSGNTFNFNISTPDVEGFKRSQSQIAAIAARTIGSGKRNM